MSLFNRVTTWAAGQILKAADLNGEFNNLVNGLNNLDGATTSWTNVKVGTLTVTGSADFSAITSPFSNWASWTPTFGGLGTVTNINFFWRRVGENMEIQGIATTGTVAASTVTLLLPNSLTTSATVVKALGGGSEFSIVGHWSSAVANQTFPFMLADASDTLIFFGVSGAGNPLNAAVGNAIFTSNKTFSVHASVPITGWSF